MTDPTTTIKAHCNRCLGETHHFVVASKKQDYNEELPDGSCGYWETTLYEMLECCGCESITLRSTYRWIGDPDTVVTYYPPAVTRPRPKWFPLSLNLIHQARLTSLFNEVYAALHAGSNCLAMMGARALIDLVMVDKVGDQGSFPEKLAAMERAGHISGTNRRYLQSAIEAGSAAAHRGHRPDDKDVNRVMDIVENLVQAAYVLPAAAEALHENTPSRPPRASTP